MIAKTNLFGFTKQLYRSISHTKLTFPKETHIKNLPGYVIKPIKPSDNERVMDFLMKTFFVEEPINKSLNLIEDPQSVQATKDLYWNIMNSSVSIFASDEYDNVVSAMLGDIEYRHNRDRQIVTRNGVAYNKTLQITKVLKDKTNPFDMYPDLNEYIEMYAGSVDKKMRGKKIFGSMVQLIIDTARQCGFKLIRMEATNIHSGRAAELLGFKHIYGIKFKDYRINNEIVFNIEPPNDEMSIKFCKL